MYVYIRYFILSLYIYICVCTFSVCVYVSIILYIQYMHIYITHVYIGTRYEVPDAVWSRPTGAPRRMKSPRHATHKWAAKHTQALRG